MFFSIEFIKGAYKNLKELDVSVGKSRKERVSGIRHLMATSQLLRQTGTDRINLAVGSDHRQRFIDAVGQVVALNSDGLYTKDFSGEFEVNSDFGVGSNFFTTRLAISRAQDIEYPGRPAPLLFLQQEIISILANAPHVLLESYGLGRIKAALAIWLFRNETFLPSQSKPPADEMVALLTQKIAERYTADIAAAISPTASELTPLMTSIDVDLFSEEAPDISSVVQLYPTELEAQATPILATRILENNLPDDDEIYIIVKELLNRGTKGLLFTGPPGTSKTWYALKVALKITEGNSDRVERVQFHPSYSYEDFIEGLVSAGSFDNAQPLFVPKDKVFLNLCKKAKDDPENLYILIIDEFSRGDPSRIFGELLTYIEADYRGIEFRLPYSEKNASIPHNIIIFATMNPYDKSVADLDAAMERRFDVIELPPSREILRKMLENNGVQGATIGAVINFFNEANTLSPHGFGHAYFKTVANESDFLILWNHKLKFIFEKMFRFKPDSYNEVKRSYIDIISAEHKAKIK